MGDNTGISWSDATWNPFVGCSNVSPACKRCYAMQEANRQILMAAGLGRETHYEGTVRIEKGRPVFTGVVNLAPQNILLRPIAWSRPRLIFVNSVSDVFHENVPDEWVHGVMATIAVASHHRFQVLTKRPARMAGYFRELFGKGWSAFLERRPPLKEGQVDGPKTVGEWLVEHYGSDRPEHFLPNLWLGTTVEDQKRANERIPELLSIPASVLFVSMEPLLGQVLLERIETADGRTINALTGDVDDGGRTVGSLGWVITGGESGSDSRPMHPEWVRRIRDDCASADVPHHFKQWGNWAPAPLEAPAGAKTASHVVSLAGRVLPLGFGPDGICRTTKKKAGRLLDGTIHDQMPHGFQRAA